MNNSHSKTAELFFPPFQLLGCEGKRRRRKKKKKNSRRQRICSSSNEIQKRAPSFLLAFSSGDGRRYIYTYKMYPCMGKILEILKKVLPVTKTACALYSHNLIFLMNDNFVMPTYSSLYCVGKVLSIGRRLRETAVCERYPQR